MNRKDAKDAENAKGRKRKGTLHFLLLFFSAPSASCVFISGSPFRVPFGQYGEAGWGVRANRASLRFIPGFIRFCTVLSLFALMSGAVAATAPDRTATLHLLASPCPPPMPNSPIEAIFRPQWQQGEAITANFWGPSYGRGLNEMYAEGSTDFSESGPVNPGQGTRLTQYFDKGRMELTHPASGEVTNGLLANELIAGKLQLGDTTFQQRAPATIPIAGDPDNAGPTYAALSTKGAALLGPAPPHTGTLVSTGISAEGFISQGDTVKSTGPTSLSVYDAITQHNVPTAFANYRTKVGLLTIGYAKSEPFFADVKVAGKQRHVLIQVFERRILTYTPDNPPAFQVEMGNIGQHYYQWRYCTT